MKKSEAVWLAVKLFGLFCVYSSVTYTLSFLINLMAAYDSPVLLSRSFNVLLQSVVMLIFYAVVGIYSLKDGKLFFDLLNRENPPDKTQESLEEISIK